HGRRSNSLRRRPRCGTSTRSREHALALRRRWSAVSTAVVGRRGFEWLAHRPALSKPGGAACHRSRVPSALMTSLPLERSTPGVVAVSALTVLWLGFSAFLDH